MGYHQKYASTANYTKITVVFPQVFEHETAVWRLEIGLILSS